jgi:hypothetical protein
MSTPLLSLIVPWVGGSSEPLKRTIESVKGIADEVVIVHQKLFDDDADVASSLADKVCTLDWNIVFQEGGFSTLPNAGAAVATGPWMLLLGVGETIAEQYSPIRQTLENASNRVMFRCNHHNDVHTWQRIWSPSGGVYFSGPIHEDCGNGLGGPVIFRMQDHDKQPHEETLRNECIKWWKNCSYHANYFFLLNNPDKRGFTDPGWNNFVNGARESIEDFIESNKDLMEAAWDGDRYAFEKGVSVRMNDGRRPEQVNHNPTGQPMSEGALPAPA